MNDIEKLKEVLKFYADKLNHGLTYDMSYGCEDYDINKDLVKKDRGKIAREVLETIND